MQQSEASTGGWCGTEKVFAQEVKKVDGLRGAEHWREKHGKWNIVKHQLEVDVKKKTIIANAINKHRTCDNCKKKKKGSAKIANAIKQHWVIANAIKKHRKCKRRKCDNCKKKKQKVR